MKGVGNTNILIPDCLFSIRCTKPNNIWSLLLESSQAKEADVTIRVTCTGVMLETCEIAVGPEDAATKLD